MFNPRGFDNPRNGGIAVLEILEAASRERQPLFVPLRRTEVGGEILGPLASMTVTHIFGYTQQQCDRVVEALYRFPLPGDAAVTRVAVSFGVVEIVAELGPRQKAEREYAEAKSRGEQAALVTRESPDVFTLKLSGLRPDEDVTVVTSFLQLAPPDGVGWSLRIPLTTSPRYTRLDEQDSPHAKGQPLALLRDPGHRFSLDLLIPEAEVVASPTHSLDITDEEGRLRVRLRDRTVIPDRDCLLSWRMEQQRDRAGLELFTYPDPASGRSYFLAMVTPPALANPDRPVRRELTLLVDHSGSMDGAKREAANWAVTKLLDSLDPRDHFALGLFHTTTRWLDRALLPDEARVVDDARQFLEAERDGGGTELGVALEQALGIPIGQGEASRHLLILTDAEVSDEGRILRLVENESRYRGRRRISILCVDSAPNSFLARQIAERGGGVARFLTSDPSHGDITTALDELLADWGQPVVADLLLSLEGREVQAAGREVLRVRESDRKAIDIGDLPAGRAVWVVGRTDVGDPRTLEFRLGNGAAGLVAAAQAQIVNNPSVKALFGAWRCLGLEMLSNSHRSGDDLAVAISRLGYDPEVDLVSGRDQPLSIYPENRSLEEREGLERLLLRESLEFGILTSATGFVAVRKEAGKLVEETVAVASGLPEGWSSRFLSAAPCSPAPVQYRAAEAPAFLRRRSNSSRPSSLRRSSGGPGPIESLFNRIAGRHGDEDAAYEDVAYEPTLSPSLPSAGIGGPPSRGSGRTTVAYSGRPNLSVGSITLFDSVVSGGHYSRLKVDLGSAANPPDAALMLLLFVDDLVTPVVKVLLRDLMRHGGERPVNLSVRSGARLVLLLQDPNGVWAALSPNLKLELV